MRQEILCSRFTAADCLENAATVVDEFLELFTHWDVIVMNEPQPLNIFDTDYATWMADYQGNIEQLLRDVGESPQVAIALSELIVLTQQQLQSEEDWQQFEQAWEVVKEVDGLE